MNAKGLLNSTTTIYAGSVPSVGLTCSSFCLTLALTRLSSPLRMPETSNRTALDDEAKLAHLGDELGKIESALQS